MWENGKEAPHLKGQKRKNHHLHDKDKEYRNNISIVDLSEGDIQASQEDRAKSNTTNNPRYNYGRNNGGPNEVRFE
jgi:hypothetical protein